MLPHFWSWDTSRLTPIPEHQKSEGCDLWLRERNESLTLGQFQLHLPHLANCSNHRPPHSSWSCSRLYVQFHSHQRCETQSATYMPGKLPNDRAPKSSLFYSECRMIYTTVSSSKRSKCKNKTKSLVSRQQITAFLYIHTKWHTHHLAHSPLSPK